MIRKFAAWAKTECDDCASEFQVTRCDPKEFKGEIICNDCEIYAKAYKEGYEDRTKDPSKKPVDVKIIQFQATPNDEYYQGITLGLGDDGVMYVNNGQEWGIYHALLFNQGDSKQ